ncbi:MAG: chromosome segregation protein, partial [Solirubrobacterales bacterium]|nr:chromosome segregation protein [Solirubrobacterales bacterium]
KVEQIVGSKPRDRRLMVEEAAGLGKHRKRRRRAQLKLERTRENLDRALDVEREARSRLRPLKRQAEAAERGAKLQAEEDEVRAQMVAAELRGATDKLAVAETSTKGGRTQREELDGRVAEVAKRRAAIEERIAAGDRERRERGEQLLEARGTLERIWARRDAVTGTMHQLRAGLGERQLRLEELGDEDDDAGAERIKRLETELVELQSGGAEALAAASSKRDAARVEADKAMRLRAELAGELAAVEARLASALGEDGEDLLAGLIQAAPGLEHALSAALGERLRAQVVGSMQEGAERLQGADGAARALLSDAGFEAPATEPPVEGATRLLDMVAAEGAAVPVTDRLLANAWLVDDLTSLPDDFAGIAVTYDGDCFDGAVGELRRVPRGATDPALLARSDREELALRLEQRSKSEVRAKRELEIAEEEFAEARTSHDAAQASPEAVRRAQIEAELGVERRHAEAAQKAHDVRARDRERLERRIEIERGLLPGLERLSGALELVGAQMRERVEALQEGNSGEEGGDEGIAAQLRECSEQEFELQAKLREAGEALTVAEVEASQLRDRHGEVKAELALIAGRLERELGPAERELTEAEREEIDAKLERIVRRREQIGPVNPLAESEYGEAREHLDLLSEQRKDLEKALRELQSLIRRTDKEIAAAFEETFEATAKNFEEMVAELFPGGSGKLRTVEEAPEVEVKAPVVEGEQPPEPSDDEEEEELDVPEDPHNLGVEIEVTPAGKSARRLSLLSGGEKSLVALAFVFAVLLARPCPFYILDEVEAALDDLNLDRFLRVVRRFADRSQFIVVTHQKRTMDAADALYGISMGDDGITKVVSRRLPRDELADRESADGQAAEAEAEAA